MQNNDPRGLRFHTCVVQYLLLVLDWTGFKISWEDIVTVCLRLILILIKYCSVNCDYRTHNVSKDLH